MKIINNTKRQYDYKGIAPAYTKDGELFIPFLIDIDVANSAYDEEIVRHYILKPLGDVSPVDAGMHNDFETREEFLEYLEGSNFIPVSFSEVHIQEKLK